MITEDTVKAGVIVMEPPGEPGTYCSECHSITFSMCDKELGYYKKYPNHGNTEYVNRRFLRFDRQSRQWK